MTPGRDSRPDRFFVPVFLLLILITSTPAMPEGADPDRAPRVVTLDAYPITIEYMPDHERVADKVSEICVHELPRLSAQLGLESVGRLRIVLIPDMDAYRSRLNFRLPSWGLAFALMSSQIMLVDVKRATTAWNWRTPTACDSSQPT